MILTGGDLILTRYYRSYPAAMYRQGPRFHSGGVCSLPPSKRVRRPAVGGTKRIAPQPRPRPHAAAGPRTATAARARSLAHMPGPAQQGQLPHSAWQHFEACAATQSAFRNWRFPARCSQPSTCSPSATPARPCVSAAARPPVHCTFCCVNTIMQLQLYARTIGEVPLCISQEWCLQAQPDAPVALLRRAAQQRCSLHVFSKASQADMQQANARVSLCCITTTGSKHVWHRRENPLRKPSIASGKLSYTRPLAHCVATQL
jgi:hypothetical protein